MGGAGTVGMVGVPDRVLVALPADDGRYAPRMLWWIAGVVAALVLVWLGIAYARMQWDMWTEVAEQSPRPWVRRGLRRPWIRVLVIVTVGALHAV